MDTALHFEYGPSTEFVLRMGQEGQHASDATVNLNYSLFEDEARLNVI
jgi:hypothetical protein